VGESAEGIRRELEKELMVCGAGQEDLGWVESDL